MSWRCRFTSHYEFWFPFKIFQLFFIAVFFYGNTFSKLLHVCYYFSELPRYLSLIHKTVFFKYIDTILWNMLFNFSLTTYESDIHIIIKCVYLIHSQNSLWTVQDGQNMHIHSLIIMGYRFRLSENDPIETTKIHKKKTSLQ